MKTLLIIFLLLISIRAFAPEIKRIVVFKTDKINHYDRILRAIAKVESHNGTYLYNPKENAVGIFQIREICLRQFNNETGKNYQLIEMYDSVKATEVFMYEATKFNPDQYEAISKAWNKSKTNKYWNLIRVELTNN
jgi:hypothetical protein